MKASPALTEDTKWIFLKKGACSHTLMYILNQEFGNAMPQGERAIDTLAGGILRLGHQCGMLWGASMAAGAEAHRRCADCGKATYLAMRASRNILDSFTNRTNTPDCRDITKTDFNSRFSLLKYMITGKPAVCFRLADHWAPEAIRVAREGLNGDQIETGKHALSCASEVVRKMGGAEQEQVMVAGFAGGVGLSGRACGALAAAVWFNSLKWLRENPGKQTYTNPPAEKTLDRFKVAAGGQLLCSEICEKRFESIDEHTEFVRNGGCERLINALALPGEVVL